MIAKVPHELTQAEAYELWHQYAGRLDSVERNCLNKLLEEMAYPEQEVRDARADVGDGCYRGALRALQRLLAFDADCVDLAPPAPPRSRRRTTQEIVDAVRADRRKAGEYGELIAKAVKGKNP